MLPDALIVCLPSQKTRGNSNFSWRLALLFDAKSASIYFKNIGSICTDSLRHGNGLSALLLLTRAAKSSAAKNSASKTRSMESRLEKHICFAKKLSQLIRYRAETVRAVQQVLLNMQLRPGECATYDCSGCVCR